jgi:hypothetical protein
MSITFSLATITAEGTGLACEARHGSTCLVAEHLLDEYAHPFPGYCVPCSMDETDACEVCSLSVNVSNTNAEMLLARLGVEFDYCGSIDPAALYGRAMVENIGADDSGVAPSEDRGAGGAVFIDCGLRPGYFEDRFGALAALAEAAMRLGLVVSWG